MRGLLLAAAAAVAAAQPNTLMPCTFSGNGVNYDLTSLSGQAIHVDDLRNDSTAQVFDYFFGVCNDIGTDGYYPDPSCRTTTGDDGTQTSGPAPAFQVGIGFTSCKRLGNTAANGQMDFLYSGAGDNGRGYARGVKLNYTGGDTCLDPTGATNTYYPRAIEIMFECYDNPIVPVQDMVIEDSQCKYRVVLKDRHGCPTQCRPAEGGRICGGHGICGYDASGGYAKCFCNEGWNGPACLGFGDKGAPPKKSFGGNIAGGFFGGLFGGAIATVLFFAVRAKMAGGSFAEGLNLASYFGGGSAGGGGAVGEPYSYGKVAGGPTFSGSSADYAAPDASAAAYSAPMGMAAAYAAPGDDGALLGSA